MTSMTAGSDMEAGNRGMTAEEGKVILASSVGTIFEWYDFYLAGSLAANISENFFSGVDPTAGFIFTLLSFAAGFAVRPFGALVFGRLGDLIGRKYTFLVTMTLMGLATFVVGLLPPYASIGILAPVAFIACRLVQGLALGGEYGGAATYVAEHAPQGRRGLYTSWIQTTATVGLFLSLIVILGLRLNLTADQFKDWGWRVPFLVSILLLLVSIWIRLQLAESPAFIKMKEEGTSSKAPLSEAFGPPVNALVLLLPFIAWGVLGYMGLITSTIMTAIAVSFVVLALVWGYINARIPLLALIGATAGQAVVWYTGQFYALFFLTKTLNVDGTTANLLIAMSLVIGTPFFIFFGWLSDKIGRKPIILAGCALGALTFFPIFKLIADTANPTLVAAHQNVKVLVTADPATCGSVFDPVNVRVFTAPCDVVRKALAASSISYNQTAGVAGSGTKVEVNGTAIAVDKDFAKAVKAAAIAAGYPKADDAGIVKAPTFGKLFTDPAALKLIGLLTLLVLYVTMVYGPIAALLVELFPTRIRYTGMSLPYHVGNGWFGGFLPPTAFAITASTGDIFAGLWYPVIIAAMTFFVGLFFLPETYKRDIFKN